MMNRIIGTAVTLLALNGGIIKAQQQNQEQLQKYGSDELYVATTEHEVAGKWVGTEIQYDETGTFIKFKFDIEFNFEQDGNRVTGTSYIKDKLHNDIGHMNIRGYVIGDKLHFEEYELTGQQWETPNRVWCFRTGELNISALRNKTMLSGDYDSYAAYDYRPCRDYCHTVVQQVADENDPEMEGVTLKPNSEGMLTVSPSPFRNETTLSFMLEEDTNVQLDVFDLSGRKIVGLVNGSRSAGKHTVVFEAGQNPPGSYLVRLFVGDQLYTKQIVIMR